MKNSPLPCGTGRQTVDPFALEQFSLRETVQAAGLRRGARWPAQVLVLAVLAGLVYLFSQITGDLEFWATHRIQVLIAVGGIGCWRWSWFLLQNARAMVYRYIVFPRLRRKAEQAWASSGPIPEIAIMATTYREKPWITRAAFAAIFSELGLVEGLNRRPIVVVATGCAEDDAAIQSIYAEHVGTVGGRPAAVWPPELVLVRADNGKRPAIAAALREIAKRNLSGDGVVAFLDGDTVMHPGMLRKVLPLFRLDPPVAAVTTNEEGYVRGPGWFAEWTSLRFGLRHRTMCSVALSGKLLCLTGRLSFFRASVATNPTFLEQIERDTIRNWLWGAFEMLSGDDKSTWYWLSRHGCRMLYVPDAMATTLEVVQGSAIRRALANIRRWSGNSLRHSWRAMRLGPVKLGWYPWWSLVDQRLAMFTVLFGPMVCLLALAAGRLEIAAGFALWIILSRLAHSAIAWRHGRRWSAYYVPLVFLSDWATAMTKIWVLFHPAKQAWLNRGARTVDSTRASSSYQWQRGFAHYMYGFTCSTAVVVAGWVAGFLPVLNEAPLFLNRPLAAAPIAEPNRISQGPNRVMFGSIADFTSVPAPESSRVNISLAEPERSLTKPMAAVWTVPIDLN